MKPLKFGEERYIGDPVNAVRIVNEKQVDMAGEAFMPVSYGGGVNSVELAHECTALEVEKTVLNSTFASDPRLVSEISGEIGSQRTLESVDVRKKRIGGYDTCSQRGRTKLGVSPVSLARSAAEHGAGEIILQSIDRESTFQGHDLRLIEEVSMSIGVPVITLGGTVGLGDFYAGISTGESNIAARSAFVLRRRHRAALITYPSQNELCSLPQSSAS